MIALLQKENPRVIETQAVLQWLGEYLHPDLAVLGVPLE